MWFLKTDILGSNSSQLGVILLPGGHLEMSGEMLCCHKRGGVPLVSSG